jgi:hypothetical protein
MSWLYNFFIVCVVTVAIQFMFLEKLFGLFSV